MFNKYGAKGIFATLGQMVSSPSNIKSHVLSNRKAYGIAAKGSSSRKASAAFQAGYKKRARQIGKREASAAFQAAYQKRARQIGKRAAITAPLVAAPFAMRPNADQSRTSYRGPMQTGRGVGRYS
jgi:hypothetical protein